MGELAILLPPTPTLANYHPHPSPFPYNTTPASPGSVCSIASLFPLYFRPAFPPYLTLTKALPLYRSGSNCSVGLPLLLPRPHNPHLTHSKTHPLYWPGSACSRSSLAGSVCGLDLPSMTPLLLLHHDTISCRFVQWKYVHNLISVETVIRFSNNLQNFTIKFIFFVFIE